jgi:hypothetical protein
MQPMILQPEDNTPEAWALNQLGEFTPAQSDYLQQVIKARQSRPSVESGPNLFPGIQWYLGRSVVLAVLFTLLIAALFVCQVSGRGFENLGLSTLAWIFLPALSVSLTILYVYRQVYQPSQVHNDSNWQAPTPKLTFHYAGSSGQALTHRPPIRYYEGSISLDQRTDDQSTHYLMFMQAHSFELSKPLWDSLQPHTSHVRLHYLTDPVPVLLSIEAVTISTAPTDEDLAQVVGIGDDGELLYRTDQ